MIHNCLSQVGYEITKWFLNESPRILHYLSLGKILIIKWNNFSFIFSCFFSFSCLFIFRFQYESIVIPPRNLSKHHPFPKSNSKIAAFDIIIANFSWWRKKVRILTASLCLLENISGNITFEPCKSLSFKV